MFSTKRKSTLSTNSSNSFSEEEEPVHFYKQELDEKEVSRMFNDVCLILTHLKPERIRFLRRVIHPSRRVERVIQALWALINSSVENSKKQSWRTTRVIVTKETVDILLKLEPSQADPELIQELSEEYIDDPAWDVDKIYHGSQAAGILAEWLCAFCAKVAFREATNSE